MDVGRASRLLHNRRRKLLRLHNNSPRPKTKAAPKGSSDEDAVVAADAVAERAARVAKGLRPLLNNPSGSKLFTAEKCLCYISLLVPQTRHS